MKDKATSNIEKSLQTNVEVESLKRIALFLEGMKTGRGGNIQPLGTNDLEQLWNAISFLQGDVRYKCQAYEKAKD